MSCRFDVIREDPEKEMFVSIIVVIFVYREEHEVSY